MEAHAQDFAKWDVWAEEEDDTVVNEAQAAQVCQHFYKRETQVDSSLAVFMSDRTDTSHFTQALCHTSCTL